MAKYIIKIGDQTIGEYDNYTQAEAHAEFLINMGGDDEMIHLEEIAPTETATGL